jgi:hypothetical protein
MSKSTGSHRHPPGDGHSNYQLFNLNSHCAGNQQKTLNRYYDKTDYSEVYRIAMGRFHVTCYHFIDSFSVLHPRHKLQYFKKAGWEDSWIETACTIVCDEFDRTYAFMDIDSKADQTARYENNQFVLLCKLTTSPRLLAFDSVIYQHIRQLTCSMHPGNIRAPRQA